MATTEIATDDLSAEHVGQYLKASIGTEVADGVVRETVVTGVLTKVEHESLFPVAERTVTTLTLFVAGNSVPIVMPIGGLVTIAPDIDSIHPIPA
ncbi:hypothetical protein [Rhodococcus maanshanensis]|nr:hypothetical protein [Rhodococcus maanshanensis]